MTLAVQTTPLAGSLGGASNPPAGSAPTDPAAPLGSAPTPPVGSAPTTPGTSRGWTRICRVTDLEVERGRAALLGGGTQIALFLLADGTVRAVSNYDPYGGAHVLSRGIVGTKSLGNTSQPSGNTPLPDSAHDASRDPGVREEIPTIASPLHKQAWDLRTGMVVETQGGEPRDIAVWPVAVRDGEVLVKWEEGP